MTRNILFITSRQDEVIAARRIATRLPADFSAVLIVSADEAANTDCHPAIIGAARAAGVVVARLMGGRQSLAGLFESIEAHCQTAGVPLIAHRSYPMPADDLRSATTISDDLADPALEYLLQGGDLNMEGFFRYLSDTFLGTSHGWDPPAAMPWEGAYHPDEPAGLGIDELIQRRWRPGQPAVGLIFYRSHWLAGDTGPVDTLIRTLERRGANVLPVYAYGLRDANGRDGAGAVAALFSDEHGGPIVDVIVNTLSFSVTVPRGDGTTESGPHGLARLGVPVIQALGSLRTRREWESNPAGFGPVDVSVAVALPEFDGRIVDTVASFKGEPPPDAPTFEQLPAAMEWIDDRIDRIAGAALRWAALRHKPNREKRVAIILNSTGASSQIGAAFGLDSGASLLRILQRLRDEGYDVGPLPETGEGIIRMIIDRCPNHIEEVTGEQLRDAVGHVDGAQYRDWLGATSPAIQQELTSQWGEPPGAFFRTGSQVAVPGVRFGNIFVGPQPQRGFGLDPEAIYHSPDLPPSHQHLAVHLWLRDVFRADALIDLGKHGNVEWLPGKGVALSSECYPDLALGDLPLIYPFIVNNPGEGTQAKRRAHAVIIDHLTPPMSTAGGYGVLDRLDTLVDEYAEASTSDPRRLPSLRDQIWEAISEGDLQHDLGRPERPPDATFDALLHELTHYLSELRSAQIGTGLHVLGEAPSGDRLAETVASMLRVPSAGTPSLHGAIADLAGFEWRTLQRDRGAPVEVSPEVGRWLPGVRTAADAIDGIEAFAVALVHECIEGERTIRATLGAGPDAMAVDESLAFARERLLPALHRTTDELDHLVDALAGRAVPAGPSGAPSRGQADILPTGRNFFSVNPQAMPSRSAWDVGRGLADALVARCLEDEGAYPESVAVVIWGTANMRTRGEDIAEVLYLLGVEPEWDARSGRVTGLRVMSIEELGRPRIDVVARVSGFFRDAFPNLMHLIDEAVGLVAVLDEPPEQNFVRKHLAADEATRPGAAENGYRVFAPEPGAYVDGVVQLIAQRNWSTRRDIAEVYARWVGHAYTRTEHGVPARAAFIRRSGELGAVVKNRDNQEHDVFDVDDYFQDHGAMLAVARELAGATPLDAIGDSTNPGAPAVRDLADEARRTYRRRVVNPRWIEGMQEHGYRGAMEMLKAVDFVFGYDATTGVVDDWMYQGLAERYLQDEANLAFLRDHNPWAMRDMAERLLEAIDRGLWEAPSDQIRQDLTDILLRAEGDIEGRSDPGVGASSQGIGT